MRSKFGQVNKTQCFGLCEASGNKLTDVITEKRVGYLQILESVLFMPL